MENKEIIKELMLTIDRLSAIRDNMIDNELMLNAQAVSGACDQHTHEEGGTPNSETLSPKLVLNTSTQTPLSSPIHEEDHTQTDKVLEDLGDIEELDLDSLEI